MNTLKTARPVGVGAHRETEGQRLARIIEYSVAIFLTVFAVAMHVRFFLMAGGLWRDEVTSVNLDASNPLSFAIANLHCDSFPILWLLTVRFWEESGIGTTDHGMRLLGLLTGLAILAALWRNARMLGRPAPVLSLALLGFTSAVICFGDSIRGYGLGMLLGLLAIGATWRLTRDGSRAAFLVCLIAWLASVHMLFHNIVLLCAAACGALAVLIPQRQWKRACGVLAIGFLCALSLLSYALMIRNIVDFNMFRPPLDFRDIYRHGLRAVQFIEEGGVAPGFNHVAWIVVVLAAIVVAARLSFHAKFWRNPTPRINLVVFHAVTLLAGLAGCAAFLKVLSYRLQPWYYLAAMAMTAWCVDAILGSVRSPAVRGLIFLLAAVFAMGSASRVWDNVTIRRTNADLIAAQLDRYTQKGDLVLFAPWNVAAPVLRYYHGPADVLAIPPVTSLSFQQYQPLVKFMRDRNAMAPAISRVCGVLRDGHRVWIVGDNNFPTTPPATRFFQPAPDPLYGWLTPYYQASWQNEVFYALRSHSRELLDVPVPTDRPVSPYETNNLSVAVGWNDTRPTSKTTQNLRSDLNP